MHRQGGEEEGARIGLLTLKALMRLIENVKFLEVFCSPSLAY
jgi:hypothetical protein